jgi:hypothetical protein
MVKSKWFWTVDNLNVFLGENPEVKLKIISISGTDMAEGLTLFYWE